MGPAIGHTLNSQGDNILSALNIPPKTYRHEFQAEVRPEHVCSEHGTRWMIDFAAKSYKTPTAEDSAEVGPLPVLV